MNNYRTSPNNTKSRKKIFLPLILIAVIITSFFIFDLYFEDERPIKSVDYPADYPDIYAGTSDGEIYEIRAGENPELVANLDLNAHNIKFHENDAWISLGTEDGDSKITRVSSNEIHEYNFDGFTHDVAATEDKIFIADHGANHSHGDEEEHHDHSHGHSHDHEHEDNDAGIRVINYDGLELAHFPLESAYHVKKTEEGIFGMGAAGRLILIDPQSLELQQEWEVGHWVGGIHYDSSREELFVADRVEKTQEVENENIDPPKIAEGYMGRYNLQGEELSRDVLGMSAIPHDVQTYGDIVIVVGMLEGVVYLIDLEDGEIDSYELDRDNEIEDQHHIPDLIVVDHYAYIADSEHDLIYRFDLENREVVDQVELPGLNGLSESPDYQVEWPQ